MRALNKVVSAIALTSVMVLASSLVATADPIITEGPLTQVNITPDLNCQVDYLGDSSSEFFGGTACGTFVSSGAALYGPAQVPAGGNLIELTPWTPVSQVTSGSGTSANPFTTVTVVTGGPLTVTQTDTYVTGENAYRSKVVVNTSSTTATPAIVYHGADCFLQNSDTGYGEYDSATGGVTCRSVDEADPSIPGSRIEQFLPLTAGSSYYYGNYAAMWAEINTLSALPSILVDPNGQQDNGMALSWTVSAVAGSPKTVSYLTNFSPLGVEPVSTTIVSATATNAVNAAARLNSTVVNGNAAPVELSSLSVTLPASFTYIAGSASGVAEPTVTGSTLTFAGPITVPANSSLPFTFQVTPGTVGTFSVSLGGSSGSGAPVLGSSVSVVVRGVLSPTPTPTITGTRTVGQVLTAVPGTWGPAPVALAYQWKRGGVAITGATASTYTLVAADAGSTITVTVTGRKSSYTTVAKTSAPTAAVTGGGLTAPVPTISGDGTVGQTLTAVPGTWGPAPVALTYQWAKAGVPIAGATGSTYTLAPADAGATVTVTVTGTKATYPTLSRTSASKGIRLATLTAIPVPTISGDAASGLTVTAVPGDWAPVPVTLAYQWYRSGVAIAGATSQSLVLGDDDAGSTIVVSVTGSKAGYQPETRTSDVAAVEVGALGSTPFPTIAGSTIAGQTLTATAGAWGPAPVTLAYQWLRGDIPIDGATGTTYALVTADVGAAISVVVTGTKPGYQFSAQRSAPTAVIVSNVLTAPTPTVSGTPLVGQTLTATAGTWGPAPVALSYTWRRGTTPIPGATSTTYTLVAADAGAKITVTVRGTKTGYAAVAKSSTPTSVVQKNLTATPTPTITGTIAAGSTLTAVPGAWAPAPVTFSYQWNRGATPIAGATSATFLLTSTDVGTTLTVTVTGSAPGFQPVSKTSAPTGAILLALTATPTPTITGTAAVGQTLTAVPGTWTPAPVTLGYTWRRGNTVIAGATSRTYTLTDDDAGAAITVMVRGSKPGYQAVARTSAPTQLP